MTIGNKRVTCLIDTGAETSIMKPNLFPNEFLETQLNKPFMFRTLNGINSTLKGIITTMPKEFNIPGTLSWKIINFTGRKYDAIIGQNFLIPLKAKIDLEKEYIDILGRKILFDEESPYHINSIQTINDTKFRTIDELNLSNLNNEEYLKLTKLLNEYNDLFYKDGDILTCTEEIQHEIPTTINTPLYSRTYRYPPIHEREIQDQIKEMLSQNIIRESSSPFNSPLWIVPKKIDNSGIKKWRLVVDYRKLNESTKTDKFPIPHMEAILDKLGRAQYFSTLDLAKGFHQILVKPEDREKTAFSTPFGHYEFIRMPFGLKNAPSTFQRLMNSVLKDYINRICVVYLDDILIFSTSLDEHLLNLGKIFNRLRETKLKIQIDKCSFLQHQTEFLGHILTPQGVKPNPKKVEIIQNLKTPNTQRKIKSFLGMTGFYRKFIKNYAKIAFPMTKFLKKNEKVNINDPNFIVAFQKLKDILINPPILRYPNFNRKFKLITDASNYALGAVLTQDGHPICYASRTLNDHEKNYSTIEKELLAIVWGTQYFRPYLYGVEFDLSTDHQPLKWLQAKNNGKDINPRLQRWLVLLMDYNAKIEYIKGKENHIADFLSRVEERDSAENINVGENLIENESTSLLEVETMHPQGENVNDNFPILTTVINRFRFQIVITERKTMDSMCIFDKIRIFLDNDDLNSPGIGNYLKQFPLKGQVAVFSNINEGKYYQFQKVIENLYQNRNDVKFFKCLYFAKDIEDIDELKKQISLYHKYETGHSGINPTYEGIKHKIYNPKLKLTIHEVINNCDYCTSAKYDRNPIKPKFHLTQSPPTTNEIVHVDTYVNTKQSFIIFIDKFSKFAIHFHLPDRNNQTIIQKLREFLAIKGNVKKFVFDNEFNTLNVRKFLDDNNILYHATKPNSHTGNSDIERLNNTITEKIRVLNLEDNIPIISQMAKAIKCYNNSFHSSIKCTPFEVEQHKIDHNIIKERIDANKNRVLNKENEKREEYIENRREGYIKNYRSLRHKEVPKYRKQTLNNIHPSNIKRPFKFSEIHLDNNCPDDHPND